MQPSFIPVRIDSVHGVGAVPWTQEVDYRGFIRPMQPGQFLACAGLDVVPVTPEFLDTVRIRGMGAPWLVLIWRASACQWEVEGFAGQRRVSAALALAGPEAALPVHCFPLGMRRHDLTPTMLAAPIVAGVRKQQA